MTMLDKDTWVVVMDGEKALFLRNLTDDADPHLNLMSKQQQANPSNQQQQSDRPGRRTDGGPDQRSAMEAPDWHRLEKDQFAREMANILLRHAEAGDYSRLVLVAPPHVMGEIRRDLKKEVADKVVAEITKTLTNHPIDQIEKLVRQDLNAG